jgi:hypothetical protein
MNSESDKQAELKKMLALKRHEQPPTQFFRKLSGKVIERLQDPEIPAEQTWRQRVGLDFDAKPVLVCAAGVGVCGLLLLGIISSQRLEPSSGATSQAGSLPMTLVPLDQNAPVGSGPAQIAPGNAPTPKRGSVDPVIVGENSLSRSLPPPSRDLQIPPASSEQK